MKDLPESSGAYPGSESTAEEILDLAVAYAEAANALFDGARSAGPLSYAPARLCAIHATELFLNAFLRSKGESPERIRGRLHSLADDDFCQALRLKKRTAKHLFDMTARREYLISRYAPDLTSQHTELTRLRATLNEIHSKVLSMLR
ncbi:hypothetical protein [Pseudaestuariivita atlantica]|uniref:HEPN domain-containing protein n=1 Tax=Pseudaestuariivita atlantica TaxID=1317121 RepID=A0A0L1JLA4_9RHOB|nr:hypothetical protein [Pseudaestuariivita atlantica]KNG92492.1 hypothetical protein ATO11_17995 [Pseudaestuariivita atlantica]